ncbi:MAG: hypothetical protein Q9169_006732 [Polycauliona sp. 2 TL-2023]
MARSRHIEVVARCALVIMSIAHLACSILFIPRLDSAYLALAVIIAIAALFTLVDASLTLYAKSTSRGKSETSNGLLGTVLRVLACLLIPGGDSSKSCCTEKSSPSIHHINDERAIGPDDHERCVDEPNVTERRPSTAGPQYFRSHSRGRSRAWLPPLLFPKHPAQLISPSELCLTRSRTCDTSSSSRYSRPRSASLSTLSRHPSTVSSLSHGTINSQTRIVSSKDIPPVSKPALPAIPKKYLHTSHSLSGGGRPVRPDSRPAMPPAEFWEHVDKQRMRDTYISTAESHRSRGLIERAGKREPSVCRYPILATPAKPVCRARRATVHSETAHIKNPSYESVRKGPLDYNSRIRSMAALKEIGDPHIAVPGERGKRSSTNINARPKRRESRTLTKQRQPSHK